MKCPVTRDKLVKLDYNTDYCKVCKKNVYNVSNINELNEKVSNGQCVFINEWSARRIHKRNKKYKKFNQNEQVYEYGIVQKNNVRAPVRGVVWRVPYKYGDSEDSD